MFRINMFNICLGETGTVYSFNGVVSRGQLQMVGCNTSKLSNAFSTENIQPKSVAS